MLAPESDALTLTDVDPEVVFDTVSSPADRLADTEPVVISIPPDQERYMLFAPEELTMAPPDWIVKTPVTSRELSDPDVAATEPVKLPSVADSMPDELTLNFVPMLIDPCVIVRAVPSSV